MKLISENAPTLPERKQKKDVSFPWASPPWAASPRINRPAARLPTVVATKGRTKLTLLHPLFQIQDFPSRLDWQQKISQLDTPKYYPALAEKNTVKSTKLLVNKIPQNSQALHLSTIDRSSLQHSDIFLVRKEE